MKEGNKNEDSRQISPAQTMLKILAKYPRAAMILIKNHMNCPGCGMSAFCTLRDACISHKVPVELILAEMQAVTQSG